MSKHTPGPWTARPLPRYRGDDTDDHDIVTHCGWVVGVGFSEADAQLMAAAPALFEALRECRRELHRLGCHGGPAYTQAVRVLDLLQP